MPFDRALLLLALACQDAPDKPDAPDPPDPGDTDLPDTDAPVVPDCAPVAAWTRDVPRAGGVVVFDELAWTDGWIELVSQMAIDVDLSGWQLTGDVAFTFPPGTIVAGGARLVVAADPTALPGALGPWQGRLGPAGEVELRSHGGRRMDVVAWRDGPPWPAVPAGHTLVKRDPDLASAPAEAWAASARPGGTPGAPHAARPGARVPLVPPDAVWAYAPAPTAGDPADPAFDDGAWDRQPAPLGFDGDLTAAFTADNHFALYLGRIDGAGLRLVGRDAVGDWTSVERFPLTAAAGDHLWIAAWEGPGDGGSPQMLIGEVTDRAGVRVATAADTLEVVEGPPGANPGDALTDAPPDPVDVAAWILEAAGDFAPPTAEDDRAAGPWGWTVGGAFTAARYVWPDTFDPDAGTNRAETYALFRTIDPLIDGPPLPDDAVTTWFRARFAPPALLDGAPLTLLLTLDARDGAAVHLNGVEVHRHNLPAGPLAADTPALGPGGPVVVSLPAASLLPGENVIAVEVHRAPGGAAPGLALTLEARVDPAQTPPAPPRTGDVVLHELMVDPIDGGGDWVELHNAGDAPADLAGWTLVDAAGFTFPPDTVLPAGGFLVVASDPAAFAARYPGVPALGPLDGRLAADGERLALHDRCGGLVDEVRYATEGRWPAGRDGQSLALRDPRADNAVPEAWAASDESARATWQAIRYRGVAGRSAVGPDGQWEELVLGLLSAGEVLIDDVQVVRDPDGAAEPLIAGGDFSSALAGWRRIGTHRESRIDVDPDDPANAVLRVVATGPTEHMHNQVSVTLARGARIREDEVYELSLRARHVAGSDALNTRLYFNRLARTTRLPRPLSGGTPGAPNRGAVANLGPTWRDLVVTPVVPAPREPVTVSIVADDPEGVATVTLQTSVDGGPFAPTPMTRTPAGRYEAVLPGLPHGAIVQLYAEGVDGAGATTTFPADGPASRALVQVARPLPASPLHTVRIVMSADDDAVFHAPEELMSNADTRVTVVYDEREVWWDVGVRAKGSQRGRPEAARLGFNVAFDPQDPLRGVLDGVSIDRSEGVITGQREILMDVVMARYGAPSAEHNDLVRLIAPRPEHSGAALLQTARFSDLMLDNQFEDGGDGTVFEYELVYYPLTTADGTPTGDKLPQPDAVIGTPIRSLGPDPEAYRHTFLIKGNRGADDYRGVLAMCALFDAPDDRFAAEASAVLDVDQWLQAFAMMSVAGAVDQYGDGSQHNAQMYVGPDGRVLLFPHDLDFFGGPTNAVIGNGDLARLLQLPGARRTFYATLHALVSGPASGAEMARWRDHLEVLLPDQPWASHHAFMVDRARWIAEGAPDSVARAAPPVAFAITTPDGAAPPGEVALTGTGWLDVAAIRRVGDPSPLRVAWPDTTRWTAAVAVVAGVNVVALEAVDAGGAVIGSDMVTITGAP